MFMKAWEEDGAARREMCSFLYKYTWDLSFQRRRKYGNPVLTNTSWLLMLVLVTSIHWWPKSPISLSLCIRIGAITINDCFAKIQQLYSWYSNGHWGRGHGKGWRKYYYLWSHNLKEKNHASLVIALSWSQSLSAFWLGARWFYHDLYLGLHQTFTSTIPCKWFMKQKKVTRTWRGFEGDISTKTEGPDAIMAQIREFRWNGKQTVS